MAEIKKCTCKNPTSQFSEDGLLEFCTTCGEMIKDHHRRKFGRNHPSLSSNSYARTNQGNW